jgi:hypothetical protein
MNHYSHFSLLTLGSGPPLPSQLWTGEYRGTTYAKFLGFRKLQRVVFLASNWEDTKRGMTIGPSTQLNPCNKEVMRIIFIGTRIGRAQGLRINTVYSLTQEIRVEPDVN